MDLKSVAKDFLQLTATGKAKEAFDKYASDDFIHHNPRFEGSAESIMKGMIENAQKMPTKIFEIQRAIREGDFVAVHSRIKLSADITVISVVHIFRFKENKIAEMWDIAQQQPENSPNQYGMF
jgi:predicted SnoaL-like aldol condensation-catalyzing enzyme